MERNALRQQDTGIEAQRRIDFQDRYSAEIMNNENLSDQRKEELKQRVRNLIEPLGQEVFRVGAERLLKKYGMKKYYDAIRKGDTKALAENLAQDAQAKAKNIIGGKSDSALKALGLKDEDIAGMKNLLKNGDPSGVKDSVLSKLSTNSEKILQNEDINKSLKKLGLSQDDIKNLPQSLRSDAQRIPAAIDNGVQKAQDRLDSLSDQGKAEFNRLTGGKDMTTENMGEHMKALGVAEGAQLSPENISKYSTGDDWDDEFKAFEELQKQRALAPTELGTGARTGASRAYEELRAGGTTPAIRDAGVPFGETPKLLGGLGGIEGAGIATPQPLSLVQRFKQYFQSNPVERGAKSASAEEPSAEEPSAPFGTTKKFFSLQSELEKQGLTSTNRLREQLAPPKPPPSISKTKALLEEEKVPAASRELTDFITRDKPVSNVNWDDFNLNRIKETPSQVIERQVREGLRAPRKPAAETAAAPTEGKFEAPKVRGGYTRSVGGLKVPADSRPVKTREPTQAPPPLPQPSSAEEGSPSDPNFLPPTLPPRRPAPYEPSGGGTNLPPSQPAEDSTQEAGNIAGEVAGGAAILKAGRSLYTRATQRGNTQSKPDDEEDEPEIDKEPPEVEPADEPTVDSVTAEPTAGTADIAPEAAAKGAADIAPKAAADIAPEAEDAAGGAAADLVPEITGGVAASEGFANPILDGIAAIGGLVGILAGSGVFSKKPPTPPSAKAVAENPEKFGLPAPPQATTTSAEEGGGNI